MKNINTKASKSVANHSYRSQLKDGSNHPPCYLQSPSKSEFIHIICRLHRQMLRNAFASIVPINCKEQLSATLKSDYLQP